MRSNSKAHFGGEAAAQLMARKDELFAKELDIEMVTVLEQRVLA